MEESYVSNLTNNNFSKNTKDSLISYPLTNSCSNLKSFSNSTNRTTLSTEEIESRRSGFSQFINSLPKICSPTICGTLNYQTPNSRVFSPAFMTKENQVKSGNTESGYQTSSHNKMENSEISNCSKNSKSTSIKDKSKECEEYKNPFEEKINKKLNEYSAKSNQEDVAKEEDKSEFDWSIDQIALLNPCDITFDGNFLLYKEFEELNRSVINKESEEFFKQNVIAPSPIVNTPIFSRKRLIQNVCKTSSPFIDYLNSKKKSIFKTPLHLSSIKSMTTKANLSKTSPSCTPINKLSVLENQCLNLAKKKLFHKSESPSLTKSLCHSNDSPTLSEISSSNNRLNCTDLDFRRFTLDLSEIGNEINLSESNQVIKSSTNCKEFVNKLIKTESINEDEDQIQHLDLNDTNEEVSHDFKDDLKEDIDNNGFKDIQKKDQVTEKEIVSINENKDVHMSISIQPFEQVHNQTSVMDFSFQVQVPIIDNHVNNIDQLLNQINVKNNETIDCELRINDNDNQMMEISICPLDNFNDKIDPNFKPKNQQLTSTPFRF